MGGSRWHMQDPQTRTPGVGGVARAPRLGSTQCLPPPGMGLQSLLKTDFLCLAVFLCFLVLVNRAFLICVTLAFLISVNHAFLICVNPVFLICVNRAFLC